jgi:hypothetical protein
MTDGGMTVDVHMGESTLVKTDMILVTATQPKT